MSENFQFKEKYSAKLGECLRLLALYLRKILISVFKSQGQGAHQPLI